MLIAEANNDSTAINTQINEAAAEADPKDTRLNLSENQQRQVTNLLSDIKGKKFTIDKTLRNSLDLSRGALSVVEEVTAKNKATQAANNTNNQINVSINQQYIDSFEQNTTQESVQPWKQEAWR